MRAIEDAISDIRSILNQIENSKECDSSTVDDINTLAQEMQSASGYLTRLSGEYNRGFTDGIRACEEVFNYIIQGEFISRRKRMNHKQIAELFGCILKNRQNIRDSLPGFIRFNVVKEKFEWFCREREAKE